jgi:type I restriction enzyme, S subunit
MIRYQKHKESGVEWIGIIPSHWKVSRCKWIFKSVNEKGFPNEPLLSVTQDKSLVRRDENEQRVWNPTSDISGYKLVLEEDYVISLRSFEGGIEYSKVRGIVSPAYSVFRSLNPYCNVFYKHLFKSKDFISALNTLTTGIRQGKNISYEDFSSLLIPIPPLNEQQQIVTYLDHKTSLIDQIISNGEKKIDILREQRTSIINHTVTKGLNRNVKMKDSGVEWIGEIPEGWEVIRIKQITTDHRQGYYSSREYDNTGYRLVRITDINDNNTITTKTSPYYELEESEIERFKLKSGDFLFPRTGGVGRFGVFQSEDISIYGSFLIRFRFSNRIHHSFIRYYFNTPAYLNQILQEIHGGVNQNIHVENIKDCKIGFPIDKGEQIQIVTYLDQKTKEIDDLISSEQKRIELLKEYRQSLISEVVTGKIKVTEN